MTNAPLLPRTEAKPSPLGARALASARGTLASEASKATARERPAPPVTVSSFTPVTGVPVVRPSTPPSAPALPAVRPSEPPSAPAIPAMTEASASARKAASRAATSVSTAIRKIGHSYASSRPTFREGVIFLSTVAVLFGVATILLDLGT